METNEWQFPFHSSIYARFKGKQIVDSQGPMTLDLYRKLVETMKGLLVSDNEFFDEVYDYCIRIEFQGRGTLHIHVVACQKKTIDWEWLFKVFVSKDFIILFDY